MSVSLRGHCQASGQFIVRYWSVLKLVPWSHHHSITGLHSVHSPVLASSPRYHPFVKSVWIVGVSLVLVLLALVRSCLRRLSSRFWSVVLYMCASALPASLLSAPMSLSSAVSLVMSSSAPQSLLSPCQLSVPLRSLELSAKFSSSVMITPSSFLSCATAFLRPCRSV
jgi:hypothetical protein